MTKLFHNDFAFAIYFSMQYCYAKRGKVVTYLHKKLKNGGKTCFLTSV